MRGAFITIDMEKFWKRRTVHGRAKLFADGPLLRDEAENYFRWCDNNPRERTEVVRDKLMWDEANISVGRPYTMSGLCTYLNVSGAYFRAARIELRNKIEEGKANETETELLETIEWIEQVVLTDQLEGAIVGLYKENLISRLNNIADNVNQNNSGDTVLRITTRDDATTKNMETLNDLL